MHAFGNLCSVQVQFLDLSKACNWVGLNGLLHNCDLSPVWLLVHAA